MSTSALPKAAAQVAATTLTVRACVLHAVVEQSPLIRLSSLPPAPDRVEVEGELFRPVPSTLAASAPVTLSRPVWVLSRVVSLKFTPGNSWVASAGVLMAVLQY